MSEDGIRWSTLAAADPALIARLPHPRAYYELGRALHRSDIAAERDAAIFALNTAHSLQPLAAAYTELGIVLQASGRTSEAEHALRKAVKFTPREPVAYLSLGALMAQKHPSCAHTAEAMTLLQKAVQLQPELGTGYYFIAMARKQCGDLPAARAAASWAARLSPSDNRLRADWRHWNANWATARRQGSSRSSAADGGSRGGILYETNLQYPWSGVRLRAMAEAQALAARAHLQEKGRLESSQPRRNSEVTTAALASTAASVGEAFNGLRVSYLGSLSDEPQMRAMASLFRSADPDLARFAVHPVTAQPRGEPDYLRFFLSSLPEGGLRPGPPAMRSAAELARQLRADAPHIVLDGLWRKECDARAEADGEGSLPCVLLVGRAAPVVLSVLAAPVTSGARGFVDYTLGDPVCLPPRLARPGALAFTERFALLPHGAYPFSHAMWADRPWATQQRRAAPATMATTAGKAGTAGTRRAAHMLAQPRLPSRHDERLPLDGFVFASFVQRWKVNPIAWQPWVNALQRVPRSVLWLLQHPLDGNGGGGTEHAVPAFALSALLRTELGGQVRHDRLVVMARQPLEQHVQRTGLADLVLDTWPYTAHTTVADAIWRDGAPWLALGASDDRMDSLLSSACLTSAGALPLVTRSLRALEDMAVALSSA